MKSVIIVAVFAALFACLASKRIFTVKSSVWSTSVTNKGPVAIPKLSKRFFVKTKSTIVVKIVGHGNTNSAARRVEVIPAVDGKYPGVNEKWSALNSNTLKKGVGVSHIPTWINMEAFAVFEVTPGDHRVYGVIRNSINNGLVYFNGVGMIVEIYDGMAINEVFQIAPASIYSAHAFKNALVEIEGTSQMIHVEKKSQLKFFVHGHCHGANGRIDILLTLNGKFVDTIGRTYPINQNNVNKAFPFGSSLSNAISWTPCIAVAVAEIGPGTHRISATIRNAANNQKIVYANNIFLMAEHYPLTTPKTFIPLISSIGSVVAYNRYPVELTNLSKDIYLGNPTWVQVLLHADGYASNTGRPIDFFVCVDGKKLGIAEQQKISDTKGKLLHGMGLSHHNRWIPLTIETAVYLQPGHHRIHAVILTRSDAQAIVYFNHASMIIEVLP